MLFHSSFRLSPGDVIETFTNGELRSREYSHGVAPEGQPIVARYDGGVRTYAHTVNPDGTEWVEMNSRDGRLLYERETQSNGSTISRSFFADGKKILKIDRYNVENEDLPTLTRFDTSGKMIRCEYRDRNGGLSRKKSLGPALQYVNKKGALVTAFYENGVRVKKPQAPTKNTKTQPPAKKDIMNWVKENGIETLVEIMTSVADTATKNKVKSPQDEAKVTAVVHSQVPLRYVEADIVV